jgi:hypothetical protein
VRPDSSPTIRRGLDGKFTAVPYSVEYQGELAQAAALLREAASLTTQPTLKSFLEKRAAGLHQQRLLRQRRRVDGARREHRADHRPYEVYEDEWFNYKAAFESFIALRDDAETPSSRASVRSCRRSRTTCRSIRSTGTPKLGALAPIRVVNTVFSSGDANRGVQTAAYNLPNDERVVARRAPSA